MKLRVIGHRLSLASVPCIAGLLFACGIGVGFSFESQAQSAGAKETTSRPPLPPPQSKKKNQQNSDKSKIKSEVLGDAHIGTGFSLLFGLDVSGVASMSDDTRIESNKKGWELGGHGLGSLFVERVAVDFGGGWYFNHLAGSAATAYTTKGVDKNEINTGAGFGQLSALLRLQPDWMVGPSAQVRFGTDTSFSPFLETSKLPRVFLGFLLAKGQPMKVGDIRWGFHYYTDINIHERQVHILGMNFSFGVPIIEPDVVIQEKQTIKYKEKTVERISYRFVYALDTELVNFETDSARLLQNSKQFLEGLGKYLAENSSSWTALDIGGHTDNRGSPEHNLKLSQDRADQVKVALIMQGIDSGKIRTWGYGSSRPLDTSSDETALARNRRVELSFEGVTDIARLRLEIDRLRKVNLPLSTCSEAGCK